MRDSTAHRRCERSEAVSAGSSYFTRWLQLLPRHDALSRFFLKPSSPLPLVALRILLSAILLWQAGLISSEIFNFYSGEGLLRSGLNEFLLSPLGPGLPRIDWISRPLTRFGISDGQVARGIFIVYATSLALLLLGCYTRLSNFMALLTHYFLITTGYFASYGADRFAHLALFYLLISPCGAAFSLDEGKTSDREYDTATLALRLLQIHLCIAYLASAIEKGMGMDWWTGEAIWRSLTMPQFAMLNMTWLCHAPWLARLLSWGTLVVEGGYAVFIWPRKTRSLWLALAVSLHLAIVIFLGLTIFGLLMITLNVCAFCLPQKAMLWHASGAHRPPSDFMKSSILR